MNESHCAEVEAAGGDIAFSNVGLVPDGTDLEPSVLIKCAGCFYHIVYNGCKGTTNCGWFCFWWELVHEGNLGEKLKCSKSIGTGAAKYGEGAFWGDEAFLHGGVAPCALEDDGIGVSQW